MFNKIKYSLLSRNLKKYIEQEKYKINNKTKLPKVVFSIDGLDILKEKTKTFSETLINFIDNKNMTDVECYKRANIDRKLFSKIRSNKDYKPSKNTVFAFSIALKLNLQETNSLLISAGYSLSHSFLTDIIVEYFIKKSKFDIDLVNIALDDYNEKPLGSF